MIRIARRSAGGLSARHIYGKVSERRPASGNERGTELMGLIAFLTGLVATLVMGTASSKLKTYATEKTQPVSSGLIL